MTTTDVDRPPGDAAPGADDGSGGRIWFLVLVIALVAAAPLLLWWGRHQWFFLDEWSFLVDRRLGDVSSLFRPHNDHWVTLPVIAFRILFGVFGLRYLPYQVLVVLTHLTVVVMVWLTMRRLHVRPVIATLTALPFVFYGAGAMNIVFAFQIALTGSLVFGLAQLLLTSDDAPSRRKDLVGIGFGLAAVMCSAVGIPMVIGTALAVLIRRGWRAAAVQAVPLALVYAVWYVTFASDAKRDFSLGAGTISFAWRMGRAAVEGLGQHPVVGVAIGVVIAIGIAQAVRAAASDRHGAVPAVVAALLVGSVAFAVLTAVGRSDLGGVQTAAQTATSPRYIYVVAALLMPVLALGGEFLARYWIVLGALPLVLLAGGLPDNVDLLRHPDPLGGGEELVLAVAHSPLLEQFSANTRLFALPLALPLAPTAAPTAGFLRNAVADGRAPRPEHPSEQLRLDADAYLALHQTGARDGPVCRAAPDTTSIDADRGTRITFSGPIQISARRGTTTSHPTSFDSTRGNVVEVRAGPIDLVVSGALGRPPAICTIGAP